VPWTVESKKVTLHVADAPDPEGLQEELDKIPLTPVWLKVIVPAGVVGLPTVDVSVTVAVHVDAWLTATGESQEMVVDVVLGLTARVADP
jgi:hypothetical protein